MSTAASAPRAANPWAPGAHARRAQALLVGGLLLANAAGLTCIGLFLVLRGAAGALSAALALAVVVLFFTVGQGVQVMVADADPRQILLASLASYGIRVGALGALLYVALAHLGTVAWLNGPAIMVTTLACVLAWVAGEIVAFRRLRIPVYDTEYVEPTRPDGEGA